MARRYRFNFRLKELRLEKNYSEEELASRLGCRVGQIIDWENFSVRPSIYRVIQIAKHFECSTDYLLGLTDDPEPYEQSESYADTHYENHYNNESEDYGDEDNTEPKSHKWLIIGLVALVIFFIFA